LKSGIAGEVVPKVLSMAVQLRDDCSEDVEALPAILCLHGYGTNSDILRYQLRQITQALSNTFRFVYIDGPFHVQNPGPGALPMFADARPFRRWHADGTLASIFGVSAVTLSDEQRQVRDLLRQTLSCEKKYDTDSGGGSAVGGIVGVIAFSQGAGLAAGLCAHPELGRDIRFAVIICALYPALPLGREEEADEMEKVAAAGPALLSRIAIPSIHIQGKLDTWKGQGTRMLDQHFTSDQVKLIEFHTRHEVPNKPKEVAMIVREIRAMWAQVSRGE
jgi:pimeloyl-ACP methyl ester carboxylesterase